MGWTSNLHNFTIISGTEKLKIPFFTQISDKKPSLTLKKIIKMKIK